MNRISYFSIALCLLLLGSFSSCKKDRGNKLYPEIADIATFQGKLSGDIVVVNTQGGPTISLDDTGLKDMMKQTKTRSALYVNVHQVQTEDPSPFLGTDITFEQAKQYDLQSIDNLKRVIDYFKIEKEKTVYVLGISFGAFMTQELIVTHGIDVADGYLIMAGRLDIEEDTWIPFSEGQYTEYIYDEDGNSNINLLGDGNSQMEKNMAKLAAGLGYNRYTDKLDDINDFSKITYVHGDRDEQVGALSTEEIQFLTDKGASVILSKLGNHEQTAETGLDLLKETFGI